MANPRDAWPKTAFGTVNWEVVFENPNDGFISIVKDAPTPLDLRNSTIEIVNQLFPRTVDGGEIDRFIGELESLIPPDTAEDSLPVLQDAVTVILRQVKDFRVARARAYELSELELSGEAPVEIAGSDEDISGDSEIDRREVVASDRDPAMEPELADGVLLGMSGKRLSIVAGGSAAVMAVVGALALFLVTGSPPQKLAETSSEKSPEKSHATAATRPSLDEFLAELAQASLDKTTKTHVFGGILHVSTAGGRVTVTASEVPHSICTSAARMLLRSGTVLINGKYSLQMRTEQIEQLCRRPSGTAQMAWRPKTVTTAPQESITN